MPGRIARPLSLIAVSLTLILIVAALRSPLPTHAAHPTPSTSTNWSQDGFDPPHTSFNPNEHVLNTSNVSRLTQDWAFLSPFPHPLIVSDPVVVNGVVY